MGKILIIKSNGAVSIRGGVTSLLYLSISIYCLNLQHLCSLPPIVGILYSYPGSQLMIAFCPTLTEAL